MKNTLVPENWIEVSVLVELRTVRIMARGFEPATPVAGPATLRY